MYMLRLNNGRIEKQPAATYNQQGQYNQRYHKTAPLSTLPR